MTFYSFLLAVQSSASLVGTILPLVLMFAAFYFLLIRPQQRRQKAHQAMVNSVEAGAEIITSSGLLGIIERLDENYLVLNISTDDKPVYVRSQRGAISQVLPKGTIKSL